MAESILADADLSGCDLRKANLQRANLQRAKLSQANLTEARLTDADLSGADLTEAKARGAGLFNANLTKAKLIRADLFSAVLGIADLTDADLTEAELGPRTGRKVQRGRPAPSADLAGANLTRAILVNANLAGCDLNDATLARADLTGADLSGAVLVNTDLRSAKLNGSRVFGVSVWNVRSKRAKQTGLIITPPKEPAITVDSLNVAQFVYLLLKNSEIREVIDTIGRKAVLILGRFTPQRKAVLDAIRDELRRRDYLPIMFDFQKPGSKSYRETVSTLAHMARFVIADITDARVILQELERIVPNLPSVPVQPILQSRARQNVVIDDDYRPYPWFLPVARYRDDRQLLAGIGEKVIAPAELKAEAIAPKSTKRATRKK